MTTEQIQNFRMDTENAKNFFAEKIAFTLGPVELKDICENENIKIIDVRYSTDYENAHIPNAISIPYENLEENLNSMNKDNLYIVYCYNAYCHLAARACYMMSSNGFHAIELCGGFKTWSEEFHFAVTKQ